GQLCSVIGASLQASNLGKSAPNAGWNDDSVLDSLSKIASEFPRAGGGLLVVVDEMGKMLESAAHDASDIHFFQDLAERANRSYGRLVVIGILHQSFAEYAYRLTSETRNEWAKIQGRYVDIALNVGSDEQVEIISRAIESDRNCTEAGQLAKGIAESANAEDTNRLALMLEKCWPLHPIVVRLLWPISRRRFSQNQRSVFGFLNSAEPFGFQSFLKEADNSDLYAPDLLWEYLRFNSELAIMASPDSHRWALAAEALGRCAARGGGRLHIDLLRVIAILGLFADRSQLVANRKTIWLAMHEKDPLEIDQALQDLQSWSLVTHRKFDESFNIFEGSDFDIEDAVNAELNFTTEVDYEKLETLARLRPFVAKRHYHETGAMRWFEIKFGPAGQINQSELADAKQRGAIGVFLLAFQTSDASGTDPSSWAQRESQKVHSCELVVGTADQSWEITSRARELIALERIRTSAPELRGDRVARREIDSRIIHLRDHLARSLANSLQSAVWHVESRNPRTYSWAELNGLASDLADGKFPLAPRLSNELLNRGKPSGSAVAARNALLRSMVSRVGEERLGIKGFPAEAGLFESLLHSTGLYRRKNGQYDFCSPSQSPSSGTETDISRLIPAWSAALSHLKANPDRAIHANEIYEIWNDRPFGIKAGLLPVVFVAFVLANKRDLAIYSEGIFVSELSDFETDLLSKDPDSLQIRWMKLSTTSKRLLDALASISHGLTE
ncbi:MAG: ATP-binding protein, partial [Gemmatimonadota bacterium]|nr:ATP-binding protein [Gemmatimonadota bacterium]